MLKNIAIKDARIFQILFLGIFLIVVTWIYNFEEKYLIQIGLTILSCVFTQWIWIRFTTRNYESIRSAFITSLGLSLLLKTDVWFIPVLASFLAISSKFIFKFRKKHIFNPANFGVIVVILITQKAWISPGYWGSHEIELFAISVLGFFVVNKVARLDIALTFIFSYGVLLFVWNILYLGWPIDSFTHIITNGTLMLFTFFMITDPMTTPNHRMSRILFAIILAVLSFYIQVFKQFYVAPLWVLFFMTPTTILLDYYLQNEKYKW